MSYSGPVITIENFLSILSSSQDSGIAMLLVLLNMVIIALYLWRFGFRYKGRYNFTLVSMLVGIYGVVMVLPSPIFFADSQSSNRYAYLISVQACPVLIIVGASVASAAMGWRRAGAHFEHFFCGPIRGTTMENLTVIRMMYRSFLAVSIVTFLAMVLTMPYVPLIGAMTHYGAADRLEVRLSVYTMSEGLQWLYALNLRLLLPFCVLYTYIMKRAEHSTRLAFYLTLTWTMVYSLLTFERQMPLAIFGLLFVASAVIRGRAKMLQKGLLVVGGMIAGGFVSLLQYNKALVDVTEAVRVFLIGRVWINPAWYASVMFARFGEGSFLFGKTIRLVSLFSESYRGDVKSFSFVADMWVNFGWIGVICGPIIYGFTLQWIQLRYFRTRTASNLIIYMIFALNSMWLVYTSMLPTMAITVFGLGIAYMALTEMLTHKAHVRSSPLAPTRRYDRGDPLREARPGVEGPI
jgi:hypothetical protein